MSEHEHEDVEVRRDGPLTAVIGIGAAALAIAYLARAIGSGGWLDWALMAVLGGIAALYLTSFLDARAPLLLADRQGIRMRTGRSWHGVAWPEVDRLEHLPRSGLLRDGRIAVMTAPDRVLSLRLSLATRLVGADWDELTTALRELAGDEADVVELEPRLEDEDPGPDADPPEEQAPDDDGVPLDPPGDRAPAGTLRRLAVGLRAEARYFTAGATALKRHPAEATAVAALPEAAELRRDPETEWVEAVVPLGAVDDRIDPDQTVVIDDVRPGGLTDPVIGPVLAAARTRLGLTVDQLADRTRIRPHVIESIEVDDFAPCGGDFYARGHLRTLARILGVDAAPLLRSYDEHYSDAPIDARRVFEAELATVAGGSIRGTRGGLNWSVLVAAVMAAVLVWSIARLIVDGPVELDRAPVLNGSPSHGQGAGAAPEVPVVFTAAGGGTKLKVRDGQGDLVFDGDLAFGQSASLDVSPPIRVWASDGSVTATIDGEERGALGETGEETSGTYVAPR
ncbi:MAG TPA: helix-turn-helix transcriptional regulator [Nocardioides sp.]|nr:helix-turn-helix transcriptional regulator [Nocardioides sp.]